MTHRVLVVADDAAISHYLATVLSRTGYDVTVAVTGIDARVLVRSNRYDAAIIDCDLLEGGGGVVLHRFIRSVSPELAGRSALMTDRTLPEAELAYCERHGIEILPKSLRIAELIAAVQRLLR